MTPLFSRTDKTIWGRWWWTVDRPLLGGLLALVLFGIVLVTTASPPVATRIGYEQYHFVIRHMILLFPAMVIMIGMSLMDLRTLWRVASVVLAGSIVLMVVVLVVGAETKGAQRWIPLFGFSLQPSEFAKPSFAVVAAWLIAKQKDRPEFPGYIITAAIFGVIALLMLMQPDIGMTIVTGFIIGAQIFLAGMPIWLVIVMLALAAIAVGGMYVVFDHVKSRVDRFLDPASGDTFQVDRALEAFRHGGLIGTGPGQGSVKLSIPDAHSDFIFAVAGEELGFVFLAIILAVLVFIILRGFNRIMDSDSMFIILAAGGLLVMFGLQSLVHIGANIQMLPAKGMTLPFISYGGSSLFAISFTMGMVLSLTRRQPRATITRGNLAARPAMTGQV